MAESQVFGTYNHLALKLGGGVMIDTARICQDLNAVREIYLPFESVSVVFNRDSVNTVASSSGSIMLMTLGPDQFSDPALLSSSIIEAVLLP